MQGTPPCCLLFPVCHLLQHTLPRSLPCLCPVVFLLLSCHSSRCLMGCLDACSGPADAPSADQALSATMTQCRFALLIGPLLLCRCAVPVLL